MTVKTSGASPSAEPNNRVSPSLLPATRPGGHRDHDLVPSLPPDQGAAWLSCYGLADLVEVADPPPEVGFHVGVFKL